MTISRREQHVNEAIRRLEEFDLLVDDESVIDDAASVLRVTREEAATYIPLGRQRLADAANVSGLTFQQRRVIEALRLAGSINPLEDDDWVIAQAAHSIELTPQTLRYHVGKLSQQRPLRDLLAEISNDDDDSEQITGTLRSRRQGKLSEAFGDTPVDDISGGSAPLMANRGYSAPPPLKAVGLGGRKAGRILREAQCLAIAVDTLGEFVRIRRGNLGACQRYMRLYPEKVAFHVNGDGVECFGPAPVTRSRRSERTSE